MGSLINVMLSISTVGGTKRNCFLHFVYKFDMQTKEQFGFGNGTNWTAPLLVTDEIFAD